MGNPNLFHENIKDLEVLLGKCLKYSKRDDCIYLDYIYSQEKGTGTRAMRCLVQLSIEKGLDGNVGLNAEYSSHLFHLRMGMVPKERQLNYLDRYGFVVKSAYKELENSNKIQDPLNLDTLKTILEQEKKLAKDQITQEDIFKNKEFLLGLKNKKMSYLQNDFIPQLLDILENINRTNNPRPDTSFLTSIPMVLSPAGKERWKKAIALDEEFDPFRDFSHLEPYMTKEQVKKLHAILGIEEKSLCNRYTMFASIVGVVALGTTYALSM